MKPSEARFTAGADIRAGETVTVDDRTGMLVPLKSNTYSVEYREWLTPEPESERRPRYYFRVTRRRYVRVPRVLHWFARPRAKTSEEWFKEKFSADHPAQRGEDT